MALDLRVSGPGLDVLRRLEPGAPALVLGRDADCDLRLPDPGRNVSRRHLGVWNQGDRLHFHVLSLVKGVDTPAGPLPPGARGVLAAGEAMEVGAYRLAVAAVPAGDADPWLQLEQEAAQLLPDSGTRTLPSGLESDDDPFGDWGFQSTFGADAPADAPQPATDLQPFLRGLGLAAAPPFTEGELETLGRVVRIVVQALLQEDHDEAGGPALRPAIEDIVRAFDPEALGRRLREGDFLGAARAWEAFARDYAERYPQGDEWVGAMIDRHFAPAYALALMRAKRNTKGRDGG